jgi:hypothetical protein
MVVTLLAGATIALAGEVTIAPLVGFSTGLIVEDLQTAATNSLEPGPVYGLIAGFSLGPERWIEVLWLHQDMEFCDGCIPEEPDSFGLDIDSLHLGGVYRPGTKDIRPYAAASAGLTLYRAEAAGQGTTAGFSFALGGGIDFLLNDWMSVRLDGRGWLTFASGTLYGGCSGGCSIGFSGAGNFQIQLFAALVIRIP